MMTKYILILIAICSFFSTDAQQYKWLKGGGSSSSMQVGWQYEQTKYICTDDNKNVYALANVGDQNITADTFYLSSAFNTAAPAMLHMLFVSYDCNGNMRFAKLIESQDHNRSYGLVYRAGKIYVAGTLFNANKRIGFDAVLSSIQQTTFLAQFDTSGQYNWIRFVGPDNYATYYGTSGPAALAIDGQGNIHHYSYMRSGVQITPSITSQTGTYDLKYDVNGNLLSATRLQLADTNYYITRAEIDQQTGVTYTLFQIVGGSITRSTHYLVAFNNSGSQLWLDSVSVRSALAGFRYKAGDGLYVTGAGASTHTFSFAGLSCSNTSYSTGQFSTITKLDLNGNGQWVHHFDGSTGVSGLLDIELLPDYSLNAFGLFNGRVRYGLDSIVSPTGGVVSTLFVSIDTAGNLIEMSQLQGSTSEYGYVMAVDKAGSLYLGGEFRGDISAGSLPSKNSVGGNSDFFLLKYGYDCSCVSSTVQSDFTFTVNNPAKSVQFVYTGTLPVDSVVWKFGDGWRVKQVSPNHVYAAQGTYTVCAIAYTPCGRKMMCKEVTISCPPPVANYTYTVAAATKTVNVTYTGSTPVDSVVWDFGDGSKAKGNTASHTYAGGDTYNVCVTSYNGCGSNVVCQSVVVPVGIESVNVFAGLSIYPNPVQSVLHIDGIKEGTSIQLFDVTGRQVYDRVSLQQNEIIDMSALVPGSYVLQLRDNKGNRTVRKVVKQ